MGRGRPDLFSTELGKQVGHPCPRAAIDCRDKFLLEEAHDRLVLRGAQLGRQDAQEKPGSKDGHTARLNGGGRDSSAMRWKVLLANSIPLHLRPEGPGAPDGAPCDQDDQTG